MKGEAGEAVEHRVEGEGWRSVLAVGRGRLGRQTAGTLGIRVVTVGLTLAVSIALTRSLGAEGFGAYALVWTWIQMLVSLGTFGMERLTVREVARAEELGTGNVRPLVFWVTRTVALLSLGAAVGGGALVYVLVRSEGSAVVAALAVGIVLVPLLGLIRIWQGALRGLQRLFRGQMSESVGIPVVMLMGIASVALTSWFSLTPATAMGLRVAGTLAAGSLVGLWLWRVLPPQAGPSVAAIDRRKLLKAAGAMLFLEGLFLVNARTDIIMLGLLSDLDTVGSYTVAHRLARSMGLMVQSVGLVLAPTLAALYAAGNRARLQRIVIWAARASTSFALVVALVFVFFGSTLLGVFGDDFRDATSTLEILAGFAVLGTAAGPVALLMVMSGHERIAARAVALGASANLLLNIALIPAWGAEGAALATGMGTILSAGAQVWWVGRHLQLGTTVLGERVLSRGLAP